MKKHFDITVIGKVQGVGFRYQAKEYADSLGIRGYARNMRDKSVVIEVEGEKKDLEGFIEWCKSASNLATVQKVEATNGELKHYRDFQIY